MNSRGPCFCGSVVHREKSGLHWVPYKHSQKFLWEEREASYLLCFSFNVMAEINIGITVKHQGWHLQPEHGQE